MGESLPIEETIREYLLGRVSDETTLEGIEERLFTDEEFCSRVALEEDDLINDYVFSRLNDEDAESFRATLTGNPERSFKLELTQALREKALARKVEPAKDRPSLLASLSAFFRQPIYAGAFAVLLVAVLISIVYFSRRNNSDDLVELRSIYQQARPTETRISEFGYAPLPQLRGAPEAADAKRLRRIEISLIDATDKTPNAQSHHALGVFYLTQQKYPDAIKELNTALKLAPQNAKIHNDLGSAYFELAKAEPKQRLEALAQSFEEFKKATELDGNSLEALFNISLAFEELRLTREAKESWTLYLQKDSTSPWATEARKHLAAIENQRSHELESDEKVLQAFLTAYRNHDDASAQAIHNETKGLLLEPSIPLQLSRRYLLAKRSGSGAAAKESLEALAAIGRFEQGQYSEFFFLN